MSEIISAALAPFIARMSYGCTWSIDSGIETSCVSWRQPLGKSGRIGRSIMRAVRVPFSPARPSRLKNEPGILPAAYMRSSTSTVSGRKSTSRTLPAVAVHEHHRVARSDDDRAGGLLGHLAGLERDLLTCDLDGDSRHGSAICSFPCSPVRLVSELLFFLVDPIRIAVADGSSRRSVAADDIGRRRHRPPRARRR